MLHGQVPIFSSQSKLFTLSLKCKAFSVVKLRTCWLKQYCLVEVRVRVLKMALAHEYICAVKEVFRRLVVQFDCFFVVKKGVLQLIVVVVRKTSVVVVKT